MSTKLEETFLLFTAFDEAYSAGFLCAASHEAYAKQHGHQHCALVLEASQLQRLCGGRAPQWAKIALLRQLLHEAAQGSPPEKTLGIPGPWPRWLVWIDADALLLDHRRVLQELTDPGPAVAGSFDLIISEDMSCASEINTGMMLVRTTSSWAQKLFDKVWETADPRLHHAPFHEQSALSQLLFPPDHAERRRWWSWQGGPRCKVVQQHMLVWDCGTMNFKDPLNRPFVVHFVDDHTRRGGKSKAERILDVVRGGHCRRGLKALVVLGNYAKRNCCCSSLPIRPDASPEIRQAAELWNSSVSQEKEDVVAAFQFGFETQPIPIMEEPEAVLAQLAAAQPVVLKDFIDGEALKPWPLQALAKEAFAEDIVRVAPLSPPRAVDGEVSAPARLWEICSYANGRPPPHHGFLTVDAPSPWQLANWRPPRRPPLAPAWLDALGPRMEGPGGDPWAELWLGPSEATFRLHQLREQTHLFVAVLAGEVLAAVCPAEASEVLRQAGMTYDPSQSAWDPFGNSALLGVAVSSVSLVPGDVLVVPRNSWLAMRSLSRGAVVCGGREAVAMAAAPSPAIPEDVAAFDEEENEVRGTLVFRPPTEILPKTRRTEEMQKRKIEMLKKRKEDAENLRKEKDCCFGLREKQEAQRRQQELQVMKEKQRMEKKKKAEEQKRREEEEQRKKMEGGLDRILHSLTKNVSAPDITACGIDLNPARLRLLAKNLSENTSCRSIDLNRKGLTDEDGVSLATMLEKNQGLLKLECEGNNLGVQSAEKLGEALRKNQMPALVPWV
eukprot:s370_g9.t1